MSLVTELDSALADAEGFGGETVTIGSWTGIAIVNGGAGNFDDVAGGFYDKNSYSLIVRKSVLPPSILVPVPGMAVTARGKELRIPDDGVTDNRAHYRISVVSRDTPK